MIYLHRVELMSTQPLVSMLLKIKMKSHSSEEYELSSYMVLLNLALMDVRLDIMKIHFTEAHLVHWLLEGIVVVYLLFCTI